MTYIGNANDTATIKADADTFFSSNFAVSDGDEVTGICSKFTGPTIPPALPYSPPYWELGMSISGLVQVFDLVAPFDPERAGVYLSRLGAIAGALLANRDDVRGFPEDPFRGQVMPAWGGQAPDHDGEWNTDVVTTGLFLYAMAAFARRVAERPALYAEHGDDAIRCITATIETYQAFRNNQELHLVEGDPYAFFVLPLSYKNLQCTNGSSECPGYRDGAGKTIAYNENLSMMKTLAELAPAADSSLYRGSADATPERLQLATEEMPLVIAKNVAFRAANLRSKKLGDGTPYFEWDRQPGVPQNDVGKEDMPHAQFELGSLAVILERQFQINALLARAGRSEHVPLNPSMFVSFANTFLRIVWQSNNVLSHDSDGSGNGAAYNAECAGWTTLAQFDPWVWIRARDTTFVNAPTNVRVDNQGALLRYRKFNSMKYLTDFAGQNWLITPAALAVGEPQPASIHDQKWLLVLSGVVLANLKGDNSGQWNSQTVSFTPDMAGPDDPSATSGPLNWAIGRYSIPKPAGSPGVQYFIRFSVEEWAPSVSLSAIFDQDQSINAGFAVNAWRPNSFGTGTDLLTNQLVNNLFAGINADLAVSDTDAWLYRLAYNITLLGKIVFMAPPVIF
jgi:hypothetical protein